VPCECALSAGVGERRVHGVYSVVHLPSRPIHVDDGNQFRDLPDVVVLYRLEEFSMFLVCVSPSGVSVSGLIVSRHVAREERSDFTALGTVAWAASCAVAWFCAGAWSACGRPRAPRASAAAEARTVYLDSARRVVWSAGGRALARADRRSGEPGARRLLGYFCEGLGGQHRAPSTLFASRDLSQAAWTSQSCIGAPPEAPQWAPTLSRPPCSRRRQTTMGGGGSKPSDDTPHNPKKPTLRAQTLPYTGTMKDSLDEIPSPTKGPHRDESLAPEASCCGATCDEHAMYEAEETKK